MALLLMSLLPLAWGLDSHSELVHPLPWGDYLAFTLVSIFLVLVGGMMSGLTVGLMSLDEQELELKLTSGTVKEQEQARRVLPVISKHHFLLVTLLVANAAAMETLPLFLDDMFASALAVILSVTFVLAFGEVIPQALCTGPDQLKIASKLTPIVKLVEVICFPISYPIAKLLDRCFGHRAKLKRSRDELKLLISMRTLTEDSGAAGLSPKQVELIHGVIDIKSESVGAHMIPIHRVYKISESTLLTHESIKTIAHRGFSRIPVYKESDEEALVGILLVKKLLEIEEEQVVSECELRAPIIIPESTEILSVLSQFEQGGSHMAFITGQGDMYGKVVGIITLEDALEVLLKMRIQDEGDYDRKYGFAARQSKRPISKWRMSSHPLIL